MAIRAILHVPGDVAEAPKPSDQFVTILNPRRKDGKPIPTMDEAATSFLYPWSRISFIELFEERSQRENVVGFFRESDSLRRS